MRDTLKLTDPIVEMSLAFLKATNRLDGARAMQIYTFLLHVYPDQKWTVSSLADAADRDRVSVRKQLSTVEHWFENNDWRTLRLSDHGKQIVARRVRVFYRNIEQPYRSCLAEMFKGYDHPLIEICELGIKWDALSRKTRKSQSFLAVYSAIFVLRSTGATSTQIMEKSFYSKQTVHRTLKELENTGYVYKTKTLWRIHNLGYAKMFPMVASAVLAGDKKTILAVHKLAKLILKSQRTQSAC